MTVVVSELFIVSFLCHDPIDHQLIYLAKGPIQKPPRSSCLLRPWLTPETNPLYSPNSNYYIRSPGLCFEALRDVFCVCLRNYGCPVCKERIFFFLPGIENRATTMLSQCFLLLLSLTNTSWSNLTPLLF